MPPKSTAPKSAPRPVPLTARGPVPGKSGPKPIEIAFDRPRSWQDVDRLIGLMAETEAELAALQAEADERVREVSEAFNQRRGSLAELLADLGSAVETYAIGHREDLGAERSMALAHGRAGWRWAPPSVRFTKTVDEVVAILEARGLDIAILVTKRPSREVLLTLPEKVLKKLPVRISRREDFYVEYAAASVSEAPPSP